MVLLICTTDEQLMVQFLIVQYVDGERELLQLS